VGVGVVPHEAVIARLNGVITPSEIKKYLKDSIYFKCDIVVGETIQRNFGQKQQCGREFSSEKQTRRYESKTMKYKYNVERQAIYTSSTLTDTSAAQLRLPSRSVRRMVFDETKKSGLGDRSFRTTYKMIANFNFNTAALHEVQ
jgi:hypothetical protein